MSPRRKQAPKLEDLFDWSVPADSTSPDRRADNALPRVELESLDRQLALLSRGEGRTCLHLGDVLERFSRLGGPAYYGYSGRGYYAIQVLGQGSRWAGDLCALSRAVEHLPLTRAALAMGRIGRSMARLLAKHAVAEDEAQLLLEAQGRTVRAMKALLTADADAGTDAPDSKDDSEQAPRSTIQVTVPTSDAWAYEFVHMLLDRGLGCQTRDQAVEAMLAEAALTLDLLDPYLNVPVGPPEDPSAAWRHEQGQEADEIEAELEHRLDLGMNMDMDAELEVLPAIDALSDDMAVLHQELKSLGAALGGRDLEMGTLAVRFWKADGWRKMGFTSAAQYARERLGCSLSSLQQRMRLARNVDAMPEVKEALVAGTLGFEAAMLVLRMGRREFAGAWVARAQVRTLIDLRDEVHIAQTLARLGDASAYLTPPSDEAIAEYQQARASVLSGEAFGIGRSQRNQQTPEEEASEEEQGVADAVQMFVTDSGDSADHRADDDGDRSIPPPRGSGMRSLRVTLPAELARWWRQLDTKWRRARCSVELGETFVEFLCRAMVDTWREDIAAAQRIKYARIYARDGYRCCSPTCSRRDVTPHHLLFRGRGGGDEDSNLKTLCVKCHLDLLHGGMIVAEPPADEVRWSLGREGQMQVVGRELKRAS